MNVGKTYLTVIVAAIVVCSACTTQDEGFVSGTVNITGYATAGNLSNYTIEVGSGSNPVNWSDTGINLTSGGTVQVDNGLLGTWNTEFYKDDEYTIKLTVIDNNSRSSQDFIHISVDNIKIDFPIEGGGLKIGAENKILGTRQNSIYENFTIEFSEDSGSSWSRQGITLENNGTGRLTGTIGYWNTSGLVGNKTYILRLTINYGDNDFSQENVSIYIDDYQEGWPRSTKADMMRGAYGVTVADLDNDNVKELVAVSAGPRIYAWYPNGTAYPGWPVDVPPSPLRDIFLQLPSDYLSHPAVADMDRDNNSEIFVTHIDPLLPINKIYGFYSNGSHIPGWPLTVMKYIYSPPSIEDVDMDGEMEIITPSTNLLNCTIYLWELNGSINKNWENVNFVPNGSICLTYASVSTIDIDNDSYPDLVAPFFFQPENKSGIYVFEHNGSIKEGWPTIIGDDIRYPVALGDLDNDSMYEIVAYGIGSNFSTTGRVYVLYANGSTYPGWPKETSADNTNSLEVAYSPVILGDMTGDGTPEVIAHNERKIFVWFNNGSSLSGYPINKSTATTNSLSLMDVNGDDRQEIISIEDRYIYIYGSDGETLPGWPEYCPNSEMYYSPTLSDSDDNARLDISTGGYVPDPWLEGNDQGFVILWDFNVSYNESLVGWGSYLHDNRRTGAFSTSTTTTTTTTTTSTTTTIPSISYNQTQNFTTGNTTIINASTVNVTLDIITNSNVTDANITIISYAGNPTNSDFSIPSLSRYIEINTSASLANSIDSTLLKVYYTDEEVNLSNLNESTLAMYWFNTTMPGWQRLNATTMDWVYGTGVETVYNFVWANVSHFSYYILGGESLTSETEIQLMGGWNLISSPLLL